MEPDKNSTQVLINCLMVLKNVKEMWTELPKTRLLEDEDEEEEDSRA